MFRSAKSVTCWGLVLGLLCVAQVGRSAPPPPTLEEIQGAFDSGDYTKTLSLISQYSAARNLPENSQDRYRLLMLRGDALLHRGQGAYAKIAFTRASQTAPDLAQAAIARANVVLIQNSTLGKYKPPRTGESMDILAPDSRRRAMSALYNTLSAQLNPRVSRALSADDIRPILDLYPRLLDLGAVEYAAYENAENTRQLLTSMGNRCRDVMIADLRRVDYRIGELNTLTRDFGLIRERDLYSRRSIPTPDQGELVEMADYIQAIRGTAQWVKDRAVELGADGRTWDDVIASASDTLDRAESLLGRRM